MTSFAPQTNTLTIFAGPCAVESFEQFESVARVIADEGLHWIRGGAFKPRTSPHSFQGLGKEGLKIMREVADKYNLNLITEVTDTAHVELIARYADAFQIGTRNMANYELLKAVAHVCAASGKPVLFKRGMAATIQEWLSAADYFEPLSAQQIWLCERGIRTFETATRFTLDISAVPVVHASSVFPVCVDVSHAAGQRALVPALARASVAAGADALMVEVHAQPSAALSDGPQQLNLAGFSELLAELRPFAQLMNKKVV